MYRRSMVLKMKKASLAIYAIFDHLGFRGADPSRRRARERAREVGGVVYRYVLLREGKSS